MGPVTPLVARHKVAIHLHFAATVFVAK